jgi:N-acetylmuramic acid 6-phosphate etherase
MNNSINLDGLVSEASSNHTNLEEKNILEILNGINQEDKSVPLAVEKIIPQIEALVLEIVKRIKNGGRLFYIGAGTSGRLGILDASECPPTYGVPFDMIVGIIAGGDTAIRKAVENAEDDKHQAWKDLQTFNINDKDSLIGLAASGRTPYVVGGLQEANKNGILTGCIVCNSNSEIAKVSQFPIEVIVGPEYVTGSTRMKSGTAQKLVLNMISTTIMIKIGKVKGNSMVDMQLSNKKLIERGTRMVMSELNIGHEEAKSLLIYHGSVRNAVNAYLNN